MYTINFMTDETPMYKADRNVSLLVFGEWFGITGTYELHYCRSEAILQPFK